MAILGGVLGGPLGNLALLGLGIGLRLAIAYFFPQKIKGPRAEDLKGQTSKFGDPLARVYGTDRVAGAVTWLKGGKVDEHSSTKRQGKALGPELTEYTYTADFFVALAHNGPIDGISRMWADKHLIYDVSAESLAGILSGDDTYLGQAPGMEIDIYLGTDAQSPDADMEADLGAGTVPAYPGMVGVKFRNFPLDQVGVRLPNIEAEIVQAGTQDRSWVNPTDDVGGVRDVRGSRHVSASGSTLACNRIPDGSLLWTTTIAGTFGYDIHITARGDIFTVVDSTAIVVFDGLTGVQLASFTIASLGFWPSKFADRVVGGVDYVALCGLVGAVLKNSGGGWQLTWTAGGQFRSHFLAMGPEYIYRAVNLTSIDVSFQRHKWDESGIQAGVQTSAAASLLPNVKPLHYDEDSDSVIALTHTTINVFDADLSSSLASATPPAQLTNLGQLLCERMKSGDGEVGFRAAAAGASFYFYRISDLALLRTVTATADWDGYGSQTLSVAMIPDWGAAFVNYDTGRYWFMPRLARAQVPLADILTAECTLAGLACDATAITASVRGYAAREAMAPRAIIEDLMRTQFFDMTQIGGVLTFIPRASTPVRTITYADMGMRADATAENVEIVREEFADINDLPASVQISAPVVTADYRTGSQIVSRPEGLDGTTAPLHYSTALVMSDDEAAQAADILFNEMRDAMAVYRTALGSKYLELAPGDVVTLPLDAARSTPAVVTRIEGGTVLEIEARRRSIVYTSDAVGQPTPGNGGGSLIGVAPLQFVPIDTHLLRSVDDSDSFYAGVARADLGSFVAATVYRSTDGGASYSAWAAFPAETMRGFALVALPDRPHPEAFDRASSLDIGVTTAFTAPDSVSEETLLGDETLNAFAVKSGDDWEIVRAASVVDNGDGTWTLSTLLRGRKGTEFAMTGHAAADAVILLDAATVDRPPLGDRGLERHYAAIGVGGAFDTTHAVAFTNTGRGLRPWAPTALAAARDGSGNITYTWLRRDRVGQQWPEHGPEDPPMSEASESYTVNIYDGAAIVRAIAASTETASYTAAEQTTDFGSAQAAVKTGILQVSAVYGDGIEHIHTI